MELGYCFFCGGMLWTTKRPSEVNIFARLLLVLKAAVWPQGGPTVTYRQDYALHEEVIIFEENYSVKSRCLACCLPSCSFVPSVASSCWSCLSHPSSS